MFRFVTYMQATTGNNRFAKQNHDTRNRSELHFSSKSVVQKDFKGLIISFDGT